MATVSQWYQMVLQYYDYEIYEHWHDCLWWSENHYCLNILRVWIVSHLWLINMIQIRWSIRSYHWHEILLRSISRISNLQNVFISKNNYKIGWVYQYFMMISTGLRSWYSPASSMHAKSTTNPILSWRSYEHELQVSQSASYSMRMAYATSGWSTLRARSIALGLA